MLFQTLDDLLKTHAERSAKNSPVAVVFCEDGLKTIETLTSLVNQGFKEIILISSLEHTIPGELDGKVSSINIFFRSNLDVAAILNRVIEAFPERWIFWCYNAEFLYFPHCETRTIADLTTFMEEERRSAVSTQVVDLFSPDLEQDPNSVNLETPYFDVSGYYGLPRYDGPDELPDQFDLFGGLKWRFEEHIPYSQRFIDRVSLFRVSSGLEINERGLFNDPEYNTISCPWHNNLTIAVGSFRTAKALLHNPGSRSQIESFIAPQSQKFNGTSQQLQELGFMEPGQWF